MRGACITWVCLVGLEGWSLVTLKVVWVCMFVHVCECVCMCVHVGWGRRRKSSDLTFVIIYQQWY